MYALSSLVGDNGMIPLWTLVLCYVLQTTGELCLSPIGLSMVTKLAPVRLVGLGMGGWFLSTAIGNNRSEEHTSELQSLMRISYAVFCLKKQTQKKHIQH